MGIFKLNKGIADTNVLSTSQVLDSFLGRKEDTERGSQIRYLTVPDDNTLNLDSTKFPELQQNIRS